MLVISARLLDMTVHPYGEAPSEAGGHWFLMTSVGIAWCSTNGYYVLVVSLSIGRKTHNLTFSKILILYSFIHPSDIERSQVFIERE